jgi:hypothetical protein
MDRLPMPTEDFSQCACPACGQTRRFTTWAVMRVLVECDGTALAAATVTDDGAELDRQYGYGGGELGMMICAECLYIGSAYVFLAALGRPLITPREAAASHVRRKTQRKWYVLNPVGGIDDYRFDCSYEEAIKIACERYHIPYAAPDAPDEPGVYPADPPATGIGGGALMMGCDTD